MRSIVAPVARLRARVFSTSQSHYDAIRTLRNEKYIALAHKETRDPVWRLLDALRHPRHLLVLSEALHKSGISSVEYNEWKSFLHDSGIDSNPNPETPSWVILYLVSNQVRSSQQAHGPMLDLLYDHLDSSPKEIHGPLILVAATQLARFNLVLPLRRLAQTFLSTWIEDPSPYFNLFLQIISCIPNRTVESANIAVLLLKAMESRQLRLTSDTYDALLNDRFVTLQLTKYLQSRMVQEGFVPQTSHLESYLRFFAKDGAIHDARRYHKAIHSQEPQPDPTTVLLDPGSVPQVRANTLMLSNSPSTLSAFTFLHQLAAKRGHTPTVILQPVKPKISRILHTKFLSVHDFTAALCVAVRDLKCTSRQLLKIFARAPGGRPTVATFTILIRGLLLRGDTVNAVTYWRKLLKSGVTIDSEALATGVVALTRAGQPYDAFMLLQRYGIRPPNPSSPSLHSHHLLRKPVKITQKTINDYMVALNRIRRPDIVFRIWDHMEKLYNVQPNALSLSILLQSARLAHRLDDTLSGAFAQLSLKNPFRAKQKTTSPAEMTPDEAASSIHLLFQSSRGNKYTSGIWHNLVPTTAARKVFLQSLFGMAAEQEDGDEKVRKMLMIESPAAAVRPSVDHDPAEGNFGLGLGLGLGSGLRRLRPTKYVFEGLDDLVVDACSSAVTPSTSISTSSSSSPSSQPNRIRSQYPSIISTNVTCLQYILLLTLSSRSNEIPLLLAWMKYLGIQPSTSTLALSLAAWSEVSVQAPLLERFQRGLGGDENVEGREYVKLVEWIKGWVGEKRLPGVKEIAKWGKIAEKVREERR
jgi:pentatricopeptide repeat protein